MCNLRQSGRDSNTADSFMCKLRSKEEPGFTGFLHPPMFLSTLIVILTQKGVGLYLFPISLNFTHKLAVSHTVLRHIPAYFPCYYNHTIIHNCSFTNVLKEYRGHFFSLMSSEPFWSALMGVIIPEQINTCAVLQEDVENEAEPRLRCLSLFLTSLGTVPKPSISLYTQAISTSHHIK